MNNRQPARPADLPVDQQDLLREAREALGDLDHGNGGPVMLAPGADGHTRLILGPLHHDDQRRPRAVADEAARRLSDAGLQLTADAEKLAEGYYVRVARRGGRPEVGRPVMTRFPAELLAQVDAYAATEEINRAEAVRRLVAAGLQA